MNYKWIIVDPLWEEYLISFNVKVNNPSNLITLSRLKLNELIKKMPKRYKSDIKNLTYIAKTFPEGWDLELD